MQDLTLFLGHHLMLGYTFLALMALLTLVEFIRLRRLGASLSATEAVSLINRDNGVVVDLRDREAYQQGHILDSILLTTTEAADAAKKLEKHRNKPLILVCYSGTTAQKMAHALTGLGFNARALAGGIPSWVAAELPLIKG